MLACNNKYLKFYFSVLDMELVCLKLFNHGKIFLKYCFRPLCSFQINPLMLLAEYL